MMKWFCFLISDFYSFSSSRLSSSSFFLPFIIFFAVCFFFIITLSSHLQVPLFSFLRIFPSFCFFLYSILFSSLVSPSIPNLPSISYSLLAFNSYFLSQLPTIFSFLFFLYFTTLSSCFSFNSKPSVLFLSSSCS